MILLVENGCQIDARSPLSDEFTQLYVPRISPSAARGIPAFHLRVTPLQYEVRREKLRCVVLEPYFLDLPLYITGRGFEVSSTGEET